VRTSLITRTYPCVTRISYLDKSNDQNRRIAGRSSSPLTDSNR